MKPLEIIPRTRVAELLEAYPGIEDERIDARSILDRGEEPLGLVMRRSGYSAMSTAEPPLYKTYFKRAK